jgi:integrase
MTSPTLSSALSDWLLVIHRSKSINTHNTYKAAASVFVYALKSDPPLSTVTESEYESFLTYLKDGNTRTEKLYATIIALFFEYLSAKGIRKINMDSIRYMRRNETRKVGKRLRKMDFPAVESIADKVIAIKPRKDVLLSRSKAFVLLLCRSGLRAFEASKLRISDLDVKRMRGKTIGKGDKEAYFIFDEDVYQAIREYHAIRKEQSDYVFISHSKRDAKSKPHPIDPDTARLDVDRICNLILERAPEYKITPHQFRHYFVTQVWRETGDIKQAQAAARHDNIQTTEGYVHTNEEDMDKLAGKLKKSRGKQ